MVVISGMSTGLPQFPRFFISKSFSSRISLSHWPRSLLGSTLPSWRGLTNCHWEARCSSYMSCDYCHLWTWMIPHNREYGMCADALQKGGQFTLCVTYFNHWYQEMGGMWKINFSLSSFPPVDFSLAEKSHRAELNSPAGEAVLLYGSSWCHDQHDNMSPCISSYLYLFYFFPYFSHSRVIPLKSIHTWCLLQIILSREPN